MELDIIHNEDCLEGMKKLPDSSIDLVATDPPYGISFMGKQWDRAIPSIDIWKECLRVLKPGAFAFVMCIPRQDCLSRMIVSLKDAGFNVNFTSIYWAYASGFPKAMNISRVIAKKEGAKRIGAGSKGNTFPPEHNYREYELTSNAKTFDGSYAGFQPKPAVEIILVVMKPLSEKTFVNQAMKNRKGITWLDDARIPYKETDSIIAKNPHTASKGSEAYNNVCYGKYNPTNNYDPINSRGRFPANLLVSDDILNDGRDRKSGGNEKKYNRQFKPDKNKFLSTVNPNNSKNIILRSSGSFSRYFSLDAWWDRKIKYLSDNVGKTFPFLIVPKAKKAERNRGCEGLEDKKIDGTDNNSYMGIESAGNRKLMTKNHHPTVKPLKLMSYLITLGSRQEDIILDPFAGSGTTLISAKILGRHYIGYEINPEYCKIARKRLEAEKTLWSVK